MSLSVFNKTIIPLALVGYEIVIANSAIRASLANHHLIANACPWNNLQMNCFMLQRAPSSYIMRAGGLKSTKKA